MRHWRAPALGARVVASLVREFLAGRRGDDQ
jgi:hypothetical protein